MEKNYVLTLLLMFIIIPIFAQNNPGDVWLVPAQTTVLIGGPGVETEIHVNTGSQMLAAYGIDIDYDYELINVIPSGYGIFLGEDGFIDVIPPDWEAGHLVLSGFDAMGKGPGVDLHLLTIEWVAANITGEATIDITVNDLSDEFLIVVGTPNGIGGSITVMEPTPTPSPIPTTAPTPITTPVLTPTLGDVNADGKITIVDALILAQKYVGIDNPGFIAPIELGDTNNDGNINILDALVIARYYVGIISSLPFIIGSEPTSFPTLPPSGFTLQVEARSNGAISIFTGTSLDETAVIPIETDATYDTQDGVAVFSDWIIEYGDAEIIDSNAPETQVINIKADTSIKAEYE